MVEIGKHNNGSSEDEQDKFIAHLEWAEQVVAGWPAWKRNVLGGPRPMFPIDNGFVRKELLDRDARLSEIEKITRGLSPETVEAAIKLYQEFHLGDYTYPSVVADWRGVRVGYIDDDGNFQMWEKRQKGELK